MCKSIKHDSGVEDSTPELIGIFDHRLGETLLALSSCARVGSSSTCSSMMINEKEGLASKIIERKEAFSQAPEGAVLSGPNLLHGICAGASCLPVARNQRSYENIPLDFIHSEFRPRTVFQPLTRLEKIPRLWNPIVESPDGKKESYSDLYRIVLRRRLNPNQERTLIASIIPPGWGHIHSVISCSFKDHAALLWAAALAMSLPIDFRFRAADRMDFMPEDFEYISSIRIPDNTDMAHSIFIRVLMLTCFNNEFADIWSKSFASKFKHDQWSDESPFTDNHRFSRLSQCWDQSFFLRNDSIRRLACIEIDVLVSMALGLSLDQLVTTYAVQFPVLTLYERSAVYDSSGHIAQTKNKQISKRLPKSISILESQTRLEHDWNSAALQPLGKDSSTVLTREFVPPYTRRNRIADYGKAWRHFAERFPSS
jgi:hypothetical protein